MYLGSWVGKAALIPGVLCILIGIPTNPAIPPANYAFFVIFGAVLLFATPLFLCGMLMLVNGTETVVGKQVRLLLDDEGVRGWPLARDVDTSWPRVRKTRSLGGVMTLPFRQPFGARQGWIPIPERALTPQQREELHSLLVSKGLIKR